MTKVAGSRIRKRHWERIIFKNDIISLPDELALLDKLSYLDMWGNEVIEIPEGMGKLTNLKTLGMRVIEISDIRQKRIMEILPNTKIFFSNSCNCGD